MKTHHVLTSAALAGLLACSIPVHAGVGGGVRGGFGGGFGGGMSRLGGFNSHATAGANGGFNAATRIPSKSTPTSVAAKGAVATNASAKQTTSAAAHTTKAAAGVTPATQTGGSLSTAASAGGSVSASTAQ